MDNYTLESNEYFTGEIFKITKTFPREEKYSLIDQVRRSSRAVPANISAVWVRRKYPKFFISKLLDALEEEAETEVWLNMSFAVPKSS